MLKPLSESYWVVPGQFLAGQYPISTNGDEARARQQLVAFLNEGFDTFFDLTSTGELPPYLPLLEEEAVRYGLHIDYHSASISDYGLPKREQMTRLLDDIDAALESGHKLYLHCWAGVGRTGTTVGCWLVRHGLSGEAALARLAELFATAEQSAVHPHSPETKEQKAFILNWG
jgi:hypothetical protein